MADTPAQQLNAILADVWSLVRLLRKLETKVEHPGAREALKRVRMDCSAHCAGLSHAIRQLGEGPIDRPGSLAKQIEATDAEAELWSVLNKGFSDVLSRIGTVAPTLKSDAHREALASIAQNLRENHTWLRRVPES